MISESKKTTRLPEPVHILSFDPYEGSFQADTKNYSNRSLFEAARNLEAFDLPLEGIDISRMPWNMNNIKDFCYHVRRKEAADLSFPVILDDKGFICDGWHRVAKAIITGKTSIRAVRLKQMPDRE